MQPFENHNVLGQEIRYDYQVPQNPWRKRVNWHICDGVPIYKFVTIEIPLHTSKRCVFENSEDTRRPEVRLATKTNADDAGSCVFRSPAKLDRTDWDFGPIQEQIVFPDFADVPLGVPCQYLLSRRDGACFYCALSWALSRSNSQAAILQIREAICDFLE